MSKKIIDGFTPPDFHFLSPYCKSPLLVDGVTYMSVQQAFYGLLTDNREEKLRICEFTLSSDLRKFGESLIKPHHTKEWQLGVMEALIRKKFKEYPILAQKLKNTGPDTELRNTLVYDDPFWGVRLGIGEDNIGKINMMIRNEMFLV